MSVFSWIVIIVFILIIKSKKDEERKKKNNSKGAYQQPYAKTTPQPYSETRQVTDEDRARLEAYRAKKQQKAGAAYGTSKEIPQQNIFSAYDKPGDTQRQTRKPTSVQEKNATTSRVAEKYRQNGQSTIMYRASENAERYQNDATLAEMEKEHQHSERVANAVDPKMHRMEHELHPKDASHVAKVVEKESTAILGDVEDLMIKGYDGNLSYERDFIGEAMDMLGRFSVPDTIPQADKHLAS